MEPKIRGVRRIQRTTIAGVSLLATIAAVVSFRHMHELCLRHGEDHLAALLIPVAVDGTIVVASMSILLANRYGSRGGARWVHREWPQRAAGGLAMGTGESSDWWRSAQRRCNRPGLCP